MLFFYNCILLSFLFFLNFSTFFCIISFHPNPLTILNATWQTASLRARMYGLRVREQEWDASCVQEMLQHINVKPFRYTAHPSFTSSLSLTYCLLSICRANLVRAIPSIPIHLFSIPFAFNPPFTSTMSFPLSSSLLSSPRSLLASLFRTHSQSFRRCHHRHYRRRSKARIQIIRLHGTDGHRRYERLISINYAYTVTSF